MDLSEAEEKQVILYSRDGLKQHLIYPLHLEEHSEKTTEGHYNLKVLKFRWNVDEGYYLSAM